MPRVSDMLLAVDGRTECLGVVVVVSTQDEEVPGR